MTLEWATYFGRWKARELWLACIMLTYTIGASIWWYVIKKTPFERQLLDIGLSRAEMVVCLIWLGAILFFALIWALEGRRPWRLKKETWVIALSALILLSAFWLYGRTSHFELWFGYRPPRGGFNGLMPYFFFVGCSVLTRLICPLLIGRFALGHRPEAYGYRLKGAFRLWWLYLGLVLVVVPFVFYAGSMPSFVRKYPFCRRAILDGGLYIHVFLVYAAVALAFFWSGEAFWRGYILLGLERDLGRSALFFMLMPYVLGHLGKPLPETLGAVVAGLVLGGLALHHRSFILGALAHWTIAMTMDLVAIWRRGVVFI